MLTEEAKKRKNAYNKVYRVTHRKQMNTARKQWAEDNVMRTKHIKQAHTARKKLPDINMTVDRVQTVYEENIKLNGTLTCCICHKSIVFGEDTLEHDIALSRGGDHSFGNLGVAHKCCNDLKHTKTINEFTGGDCCG